MALHLIVDGYNLLAKTGRIGAGTSLHSEMARESFLRDLAAYRQRKSHAITVVFDGWQQGWGMEQREHRLGLEIIFSRRGEKADQVIQRLAAEFGSSCAVVSSDREIIDFARRSEEHTSELQSPCNLVCRLLLEKKKIIMYRHNV